MAMNASSHGLCLLSSGDFPHWIAISASSALFGFFIAEHVLLRGAFAANSMRYCVSDARPPGAVSAIRKAIRRAIISGRSSG